MSYIISYFLINTLITVFTIKDFDSMPDSKVKTPQVAKNLILVVMILFALPLMIVGKITKMIKGKNSFKNIENKIKSKK